MRAHVARAKTICNCDEVTAMFTRKSEEQKTKARRFNGGFGGKMNSSPVRGGRILSSLMGLVAGQRPKPSDELR
jgi:hypothetical protein